MRGIQLPTSPLCIHLQPLRRRIIPEATTARPQDLAGVRIGSDHTLVPSIVFRGSLIDRHRVLEPGTARPEDDVERHVRGDVGGGVDLEGGECPLRVEEGGQSTVVRAGDGVLHRVGGQRGGVDVGCGQGDVAGVDALNTRVCRVGDGEGGAVQS